MKNITGVIITLNEENNIKDCIASLKSVCNEIVVLDSNSSDNTVKIAKELGAKTYIQDYLGDGPQKKAASKYATNDWVLSIDADERLDEDMKKDILNLDLETTLFDAFAFRRKNFIGDRWQKIWYPDYVVRLYNKNKCNYIEKKEHAYVKTNNFKKLNSHIIHFSYKDYSDMAKKINKFAYRSAVLMYEKKRKVNYLDPILHSINAFFRKYFFKKGIFYGIDGLTISIFTAFIAYLKYAMLIEMYKNSKK